MLSEDSCAEECLVQRATGSDASTLPVLSSPPGCPLEETAGQTLLRSFFLLV